MSKYGFSGMEGESCFFLPPPFCRDKPTTTPKRGGKTQRLQSPSAYQLMLEAAAESILPSRLWLFKSVPYVAGKVCGRALLPADHCVSTN